MRIPSLSATARAAAPCATAPCARATALAVACVACAAGVACTVGVACAAHRPGDAAAASGRCDGQPYVVVSNPLPDRAYLQFVTASGRAFFIDLPLQPREMRRIEIPRRERVVRAYATTEAWRVERPGRPAVDRSTGTRIQIHAGCAAV